MITRLFSKPPELISLHIPKTAGTSFRNILKSVYGDREVLRFDISERGIVRVNEEQYNKSKLPSVKVIHGHFTLEALENKFDLPEEYKLITWVRDPVKRVVSNYNYLEDRLREIHEQHKGLNILSKMQRTLAEFSRAEVNRNRQFKFLKGRTLDEFDFVGIAEMFDSELIRLARTLEWPVVPEPLHQNRSSDKKREIDENLVKEIRELNEMDEQIYQKAIEIRERQLM